MDFYTSKGLGIKSRQIWPIPNLANTYVDVLLFRSNSFVRQQARGARELLEPSHQAGAGQVDAQDALRKFQSQTGGAVKLPDEARADLQRLT